MCEPLVLDARRRDHVEDSLPHLVTAVGATTATLVKELLNPSGLGIEHEGWHIAKASADPRCVS
jgi:hypothetical protein